MKRKATLIGIISAGIVSAQLAMPVMAHAATANAAKIEYAPTTISASGAYLAYPEHVVAHDPWSGDATSWVPLYYLQKSLTSLGVKTSWNGSTLNVTSAPSAWKLKTGNPPYTSNPPSGEMQFAIDGAKDGYVRAPKLVAKDPASGEYTAYVPVYYADVFLHSYLSMGASWNGDTWVLSPQATGSITQTTYASWAAASKQVESVRGYLDFPQGDPTVNLGYGITARTDAAMMHAGYAWNEGRWKVEVLYYTKNQGAKQLAENVVAYLHDHMLPAPNNQGVILIQSTTSPSSTAINPKTTVAWQEGNTVYRYASTASPTQALQTVVDSNHG